VQVPSREVGTLQCIMLCTTGQRGMREGGGQGGAARATHSTAQHSTAQHLVVPGARPTHTPRHRAPVGGPGACQMGAAMSWRLLSLSTAAECVGSAVTPYLQQQPAVLTCSFELGGNASDCILKRRQDSASTALVVLGSPCAFGKVCAAISACCCCALTGCCS